MEDSVIKVYRFCRVVFGLNASPFLLNGTLRHHLVKFKEIDPEFVEMLVNSFYVDDLVTGSNTPEEAYELYVKSKSNLKSSALWWNGPHWLTGPEQGWPALHIERTPAGAEEEKGTVSMVVNTRVPKSDISSVINPNNFSNCSKLFKVTAYVRRFVHNVRAEKVEDRMTGRLSREEMTNAELEWIKSAQVDLTQQATFNQLTKQLDLVEGILRCRGRLGNSELATDARMPIILPRDHRLTELVILDCHSKLHHSGVSGTLAQLRTRFWVPKGRQVVKKIVHRCVTCKKLEGRAYATPPVADLPGFRVTQAEPFSKVGVDFTGPLYYKSSTCMMQKAHVALFSCCVTRALYLDLVVDLEACTFRRCLRRFAARKGAPTLIVSDNAKDGGSREVDQGQR
ncbi:uncharacterized protein LOC125568078 [Nematostella vectensis]|uniref:uncharacterized protein LOC125568078 n=1 Tax=Nematostella vectensis TaxID=45351 RepID=UPI002077946A|nr:uncharacterized protein LOC125568078 [Nematostella vectensis]